MKTKIILSIILFMGLGLTSLYAQNPIATLEHNGTTNVFYGQNAFIAAYDASVNSDQIYLSTGFFTPPPSIAKGIKITGAGHFPDSANVAKRTFIMGGLTINVGADSLQLEGLYIYGDINYADANHYNPPGSINFVKVIRCWVSRVCFNSSATYSRNNCSYEECFINDDIYCNTYVNNFLLRHCLINGTLHGFNNAKIDGNILLRNNIYPFDFITASTIENNVIFNNSTIIVYSSANQIFNNLFVISSFDFSNNLISGNYFGVPQSDIFINQTGNSIDYTHDYHLKNPELYLGTDGTQVGIYGGTNPFKEKGLPSSPQITSKTIAPETDTEGNLKVNMTVKAQSR